MLIEFQSYVCKIFRRRINVIIFFHTFKNIYSHVIMNLLYCSLYIELIILIKNKKNCVLSIVISLNLIIFFFLFFQSLMTHKTIVQKIIMIIKVKKLKKCLIFSFAFRQRAVFKNKIDFIILTIIDARNDFDDF